jgi:pimeloyl-ACP methyl ester carboxylesterase
MTQGRLDGPARFGVLGVSMGAAIAYACAAAHPERVTSVVILSEVGPFDGRERLRADSKADNAFWWLVARDDLLSRSRFQCVPEHGVDRLNHSGG